MRTLLYIALLFISPEIFAGVFDPVPTDKSVALLGAIFGDKVGNIALGGNANPILANMMDTFNFIIVVVGTVVVSYVTILSTINTAQEGTAMGKKWSAVWIPMRSIAGMALMVPSPASGYSMIQVTVMWIVIQGIGAANQIWDIALDGLASGVSASKGTASNSDPRLMAAGTTLAKQLLNVAICMETIYKASKEPINIQNNQWASTSGQYVKDYNVQDNLPNGVIGSPASPTPPFSSTNVYTATVTGTIFFGVNDSAASNTAKAVCGKLKVKAIVKSNDFPIDSKSRLNDPQITVQDVNKMAQEAYDIKVNTVGTMLGILSTLAKTLVNDTSTTPSAIPNKDGGQPDPAGYMSAASEAYIDSMSALVKPGGFGGTGGTWDPLAVAGANITNNADSIKKIVTAGKTNGWISAGSFYFIFNETLVPEYLATAIDDPIVDPGVASSAPLIPALNYTDKDAITSAYKTNLPAVDDSNVSSLTSLSSLNVLTLLDVRKLTQYLAYAHIYQKNDLSTGGGDSAFSSGSDTGDISGLAGGANALILQNLHSLMDGNQSDPLMAHAIFGRALMITSEVTVSAAFAAVLYMAWTTAGGLGTGLGPGLIIMLIAVCAALLGYLGSLWAFGAMLAIYAPFIPFMIFTLTALGWMLTVVESIIAAPIIALGLVMPSGDEMGKLEHALMLLANIFLRPLLMIFGFLLAGGVYKAVVTLIDFGMADVMESIQVNTMFSSLALIAVYTTFIIAVANQSFSLIYAVPDKILRWLGVSGEQTNVSAVGDVKHAAQKSASALGGEGAKQMGGVGSEALKYSANKDRTNAGGSKGTGGGEASTPVRFGDDGVTGGKRPPAGGGGPPPADKDITWGGTGPAGGAKSKAEEKMLKETESERPKSPGKKSFDDRPIDPMDIPPPPSSPPPKE